MIPDFHRKDPLPDLRNHPCAFMSQHCRQWMLRLSRHQMPITVTNSGRGDFHQDFAGLGVLEVEGFDFEGGMGFVKNGGGNFHGKLASGA